ncbi:hypothetical protein KQI36_15850 [Clostridium senegalense]|uniref:hypothetical protein n=1 Tax=Clostridium senegalense TaxID=1465809 RepID=UPI001C123C90|nr:hypothetical protein [Clostridium senegalense]MBU5228106.1 hypothetical protein [Clostridium senegalense]
MKKTVSFSLEEDIIEAIENYQKQNKLSSKSAALERMILSMKNKNENIEDIIKSLLNNNNNIKENKEEVMINDNLEIGIDSCYNDMPD